jgi:hypothetical protein
MKQLGTILPTREGLVKADAFADARAAQADTTGRKMFPGCERRVVGGEVRYYDTTNRYAIIGRNGQAKWFRVTPSGDYRI